MTEDEHFSCIFYKTQVLLSICSTRRMIAVPSLLCFCVSCCSVECVLRRNAYLCADTFILKGLLLLNWRLCIWLGVRQTSSRPNSNFCGYSFSFMVGDHFALLNADVVDTLDYNNLYGSLYDIAVWFFRIEFEFPCSSKCLSSKPFQIFLFKIQLYALQVKLYIHSHYMSK